jgi:hypothetical protein
MPWQFVITSPERSKRMGLHGIGLKFPAPISASIFSRAAACFPPGEKSCSNSSSQTSLSCRAMNAASLASSSRLSSFTAFSISVRLTLLRWPQQRRKPIRSRPEAASASLMVCYLSGRDGLDIWGLTIQLTDGGPSVAPVLPRGVAGPPFGGALGWAVSWL